MAAIRFFIYALAFAFCAAASAATPYVPLEQRLSAEQDRTVDGGCRSYLGFRTISGVSGTDVDRRTLIEADRHSLVLLDQDVAPHGGLAAEQRMIEALAALNCE